MPEATRYTLVAAPGLQTSHFALGLMTQLSLIQARTGRRASMQKLATEAGVSVETIRRVLYGVGTFEARILTELAEAVGASRWEKLSQLGRNIALAHKMTMEGDL